MILLQSPAQRSGAFLATNNLAQVQFQRQYLESMFTSIITHPGGAHKDDFLACCVLLTQASVSIYRQDPSADDLKDPSIAVVDVGLQHASEINNYDHHQLPREQVPTCALSLVLKDLGFYEDARDFCDWLETSEWLDCRGPADTAKWLGTDPNVLAKLNSPIDITLLRRFASQLEHHQGEPLWEVMLMIGQDLIEYIKGLRSRIDFISEHAEIWNFKTKKALFMPRTDPLPKEPSAGLARYLSQKKLDKDVIAMIYPDSRGTGYGMRRFNDDQSLDFTQISSQEDVHFTHARGFIAKTSANTIDRLAHLLQLACKQ